MNDRAAAPAFPLLVVFKKKNLLQQANKWRKLRRATPQYAYPQYA
jgi:hypothetical protein